MSANVIEAAAGKRREILAAISSAKDADGAAETIADLLAVSADQAREVLGAPLESFIGHDAAHPGADSRGFALLPFRDSEDHRALFHARSSDSSSATAGEWDEERTELERNEGLKRVEAESAMWFVAVDTARDTLVGLVFGEQTGDGDVDVAIWIRPEERKKGFGMESLKECGRELAAFFPGKHVIVRAPLTGDK